MKLKTYETYATLIGLVAGIIYGQFIYDPNWSHGQLLTAHLHATELSILSIMGNTIFMGLLKMLIMPLIVVSVVSGIASTNGTGKIGTYTLLYYFATMLIAVTVGLILVTTFSPGVAYRESLGVAALESAVSGSSLSASLPENALTANSDSLVARFISMLIPENLFGALAKGETLPVIMFSIFLGIVLSKMGKRAQSLRDIFDSLFAVLINMVKIVLYLAPFGVFALIALSIATVGLQAFGTAIGQYMFTVLAGLIFHGLIVLPLLLFLFTKSNPFKFLGATKRALSTAFATSSSSATLPVSFECLENEGTVKKSTASLVLPLGSTINMDGTALYEAVAVVFLAQCFGINLGLGELVIIALTATLAAIGAASIPSAGLVTMVIVINAVNDSLLAASPEAILIPLGGVGLILGVDRILDMVRTTVNVWGDLVGAKIVCHAVQRRAS